MRVSLRATFVAAAAVAGLIVVGSPAVAAPEGQVQGANEAGAIKGRYIVVLKDEVAASNTAADAAELVEQVGGTVRRSFGATLKGFTAQLTEGGAKRLAASPLVDYVQQDTTVRLADTEYSAPWGLDRLDQQTRALSGTYTYPNTAGNVTAYVLDTGVRLTHGEFAGRARSGYDFIDNDTDASDCHGHGTHVAGTIGGSTYGVAKNVNLVSVRVLDCEGSGSYSAIIAGIDWITANAQKPAVVNMSLGGTPSEAVDQAVRNAVASGLTFVVAAGNENADACGSSPARTAEAIAVGAVDAEDTRAPFSNYGSCVDVFAPGVAIASSSNSADNGTEVMSGTSMATPHAAGAAALYLSANPSAGPALVRDALLGNAVQNTVTDAGAGSPNRLLVNVGTPVVQPVSINTAPSPVTVPAACNVKTNGTNGTIKDKGTATTAVVVTGCAGKAARNAKVEVHAVHGKRGDLTVELIAPNGSVKKLKSANKKDTAANLNAVYTVNLSARLKNGTWKLRVRDTAKGSTGYLDSWTLTV